MRVVETSLWIEYISDGALADQGEKHIEPLTTCIAPTMVQYEIIKWCARNFDAARTQLVRSLLTECISYEMDHVVAYEAAQLSITHKLHATDAIIYATARVADAVLYTCDAHFKGLPGVEYFEKA